MDSNKKNDRKNKNKNKNKKEKITKLDELGLEQGKIYKFMGRWRKLHSNKKLHQPPSFDELHKRDYKIRKFDYVVLFSANLKETSNLKRKYFRGRHEQYVLGKLKSKGYKVRKVTPAWPGVFIAEYFNTIPEYSGRLYIGYGERFGWVNIVQLSKQEIVKQFKKVELEG